MKEYVDMLWNKSNGSYIPNHFFIYYIHLEYKTFVSYLFTCFPFDSKEVKVRVFFNLDLELDKPFHVTIFVGSDPISSSRIMYGVRNVLLDQKQN